MPDARLVVDHFHVIRLANQALDEVRRRVQHATLGHRGRKGDPLYRIRRRLLASHKRLSPDGFERVVMVWLDHGDPDGEVAIAYLAKELLRETSTTADNVFEARRQPHQSSTRSTTAPRSSSSPGWPSTIRRWETPLLRWHTTGLTNAGSRGHQLDHQEHQVARVRVHATSRTIDSDSCCDVAPHGRLAQHHQYEAANPASPRRAKKAIDLATAYVDT